MNDGPAAVADGRPVSARRWFNAIVVAQVIVIWVLPVFPAQDLPQHLGYARILMDYQRSDLPFHDLYVVADKFQFYFTTHHVLSALGRLLSLEVALKLLLSGYVAGVLFGFRALAAAFSGARQVTEAGMPALLGTLIVWGPTGALGLLPFMLALPPLLMGCALVIRQAEAEASRYESFWLLGCAVAACLFHPIAGLCLGLWAGLHAAVNPARRRARAALICVAAVGLTLAVGAVIGESGLGSRPSHALRIAWHNPLQKLTFVLAAVLGPYRSSGQLLVAAALAATGWVVWRNQTRNGDYPEASPARRAIRRTVLVFAVLCLLAPSGIRAPTELLFLDLRLLHLAVILALALVGQRHFASRQSRHAVIALGLFATVHFAGRSLAFARETDPLLRLIDRAKPPGLMMPLMLHNQSAHFGGLFRLTHFLPMYYTVRNGGPSTQFWARYTDHLPVDHRPGRAPQAPGDWFPWEVRAAQLRQAEYVLVEAATADDPGREREATLRIQKLLSQIPGATTIDCQGNWCLHRVRGGP